jgi:hypothetical protein
MRTIAAVLMLLPVSSFAQTPCGPSTPHVLQFDPYKPSHTAIMRNYGGVLLAQLPISELLKLDPYVPTQAALLRQLGGAIPVWPYAGYPFYQVPLPYSAALPGAPCEPTPEPEAPTAAITTVNELIAALGQQPAPAVAATGRDMPARNSGITLEHAGRVWVSAGRGVRFSEEAFVRVGERAGSPIFQRRGGDDSVIYVPTIPGVVAPFSVLRK